MTQPRHSEQIQGEIDDQYGLSPLQQGMLFHTLRDAGGGMYVSQAVARLDELDPERLRRAWERAMQRHPILRTSFHWDDPEHPVQRVHRGVQMPFEILDWRGNSPSEQSSRLRDFQRRDLERGFDLRRAPLIRVTLIRVGPKRWFSISSHHHIILDGWSGGILAAEIRRDYEAGRRGRDLVLPVPRPFADYIRWVERQDPAHSEQFWRQHLAGIDEATPLPFDRGPASTRGKRRRVESWSIRIDPVTTQALDGLARDCRVTITTLVQAAWALLLSRHSGRRRVLFGMLVSGRPPTLLGVEAIVGMFLNTLPFLVRVDLDAPLKTWLKQIQAEQIALQDHEQSPLVLVQQWSEVPAGKPLFDSIIARKDVTRSGKTGVGSRRPARSNNGGRSEQSNFQQNYPLLLNILASDGLELKLTYDQRRFGASDVTRVMEQLQTVLTSMIADPAAAVGKLGMMSEQERLRFVGSWGECHIDPVAASPAPVWLHQLFERAARKHPDRPASARLAPNARGSEEAARRILGNAEISFCQLEQDAELLARRLVASGARRGEVIPVLETANPDCLVALLAVLKTGAAYLPLASTNSEIAEIVAAAGARQLLGHAKDLATIAVRGVELFRLDQPVVDGSTEIPPLTGPDDSGAPAYLLVQDAGGPNRGPRFLTLSHHAAICRATALASLEITQVDLLIQHPWESAAFQAALFALWTHARCAMLPCCGIPRSVSVPRAMGMLLTPTQLRELLDYDSKAIADNSAMRHWACTGEPLSADLRRRFGQLATNGASLYNLYGSTESGICLGWRAQASEDLGPHQIGKPLPGYRVQILDSQGEVCPIGVPGELVVSGPGIGRGGTSSADTPSKGGASSSGRSAADLLATGDLARWRTDGTVEWLGRLRDATGADALPTPIDAIEDALRIHAPAGQAAVVLCPDGSLTAWLSSRELPDLVALQRELAQIFPRRLLPKRYHLVEQLPISSRGVIDRRGLASSTLPGIEVKLTQRPRVPAASELERMIIRVWQDVLRQDDVSVDDNFFDLGGHSLSATRVASRLTKRLAREVPLHAVFEAPTVRALAEWIESGEHEQHLPVRIEPTTQGKLAPVAFTQQQLWVLAQLFPDIPAYTIPSSMRFYGQLDLSRLEVAVLRVIERHEILRTRFVVANGQPMLEVCEPPAGVEIESVDLSALSGDTRERESTRIMRQKGGLPWDLERGPLLRSYVITLSPREHIVNTLFHHIIADGPSVGIFSREVERIYSALVGGDETQARLPRLALQYADFAVWERESVKGPLFDKQLAYWRQALEGWAPLEVPPDLPRPAVHRFRGKKVRFRVERAALRALKDLAREERVTLFMCVLAVFQTLLSRYSGQHDVLVGSAMTNRIRTELEPLIGLFVNTIPLRTDLSGDPSFRQLLARVRRACLGAFANMDLPFEETVRVLQPDRDLSRQGSPLFQYMLINQPPGQLRQHKDSGFGPGESHNDTGFSNFDILLSTHEILDRHIDCTLAYDTDLFTHSTINGFIERYLALFDAVVRAPDRPLAEFTLLTATERAQLLGEWNGAPPPVASECVHTLIDAQARERPHATALVFQDKRVNYRELGRLGNAVARQLIARGIGRDQLVGICLDRGIPLIAAMLGALKANAAFVPMDPGYPPERLRHIIQDTGSSIILSDQDFDLSVLPSDAGVEVLDIEALATPEVACDAAVACPTDPSALAYVIYTSGSTGLPKGVMVEHRNLSAVIRAQCRTFEIDHNSRVLQTLSPSFDAALGEIFRALVAGATLYLAARDDVLPGPGLIRLLRDNAITAVAMSATALANLPAADGELPALKTLIVGGEACPPQVAARWGSGRNIINGYGPTETTIGATSAKNWDLSGKPPLGRALPGVRVYVLDEAGRLVPVGLVGELYIGGVGVARGYLNRPELDKERFVSDPFVDDSGARMYRTGDLVRWRSDGMLEFIGRNDQQVKISGHRIEMGEIETAIVQHPEIGSCALKVNCHQGVKRLVAYLVASSGQAAPEATDLRRFLKQRIPEYMIPASYLVMPRLPMTANGKIDRNALPEPDFRPASTNSRPYAAPRTPLETRLAALWSEVLGLLRVGRDDNFFEYGGDSISSIRVVARANEQGIALDPKDIFMHQTVGELAAFLAGQSPSPGAGQTDHRRTARGSTRGQS